MQGAGIVCGIIQLVFYFLVIYQVSTPILYRSSESHHTQTCGEVGKSEIRKVGGGKICHLKYANSDVPNLPPTKICWSETP